MASTLYGNVQKKKKKREKPQMEYAYPTRHAPVLFYLVMFSIAMVVEKEMEVKWLEIGQVITLRVKA